MALKIVYKKTDELVPYANNPRNNDQAVEKVANSIKQFGFNVPIVIDKGNEIVCGHTRLRAAQSLGLTEVPCVVASNLTPAQIQAYRLADNKTAELAGWDFDKLEVELAAIKEDLPDLDMGDFGFVEDEIEPDKKHERKQIDFPENISVVIDCQNDEEAEKIYNDLTNGGYQCRISTL